MTRTAPNRHDRKRAARQWREAFDVYESGASVLLAPYAVAHVPDLKRLEEERLTRKCANRLKTVLGPPGYRVITHYVEHYFNYAMLAHGVRVKMSATPFWMMRQSPGDTPG